MRVHIRPYFIILALTLFVSSACKTFEVKNVNYGQQIESVLSPNAKGEVHDSRYSLSFNILPFQYQETQDSSAVSVREVRLIRNNAGLYFITADGFSNVYVMEPINNGLKLKKKIQVSDQGLIAPAFNMRNPYIELVDKETAQTFTLNENGIHKKPEVKS
ncbi:MAG: hypothetical protein WC967_03810 [Balneolaceae bacterium]